MGIRFLTLLLLVALALPEGLSADQIGMQVEITGAVSNGLLTARVELTNRGDAAAHDCRALLRAPDGASSPESTIGLLPAGASASVMLSVRAADGPAGSYAAVCRIAYRDAAGHDFSTATLLPYIQGHVPDAMIAAVAVAAEPLNTRGLLKITAASLTGAPLPCRLRLLLPDEIEAGQAPETWALPPQGGTLSIPLRNISATHGSRYPVSVVLETTHDGEHHAFIASNLLEIGGTTRRPSLAAVGFALMLFGVLAVGMTWKRRERALPRWHRAVWDVTALSAATACIVYFVAPAEIFSDTLCVGGDTIAHHYMATHLREQLLHHGRIVSWAPGWWCGFPLFRYYFPLPYVVIALLDLLLPYNIAFKLGALLGLLALPLAAYLGGCRLRLPPALPALLALATLPLALDTTHTMWGVNAYSTLAGMIANSYSFSLMLLAIPAALCDALEGRPRPSTVLLLWAVVMSHFFTSLMTAGILLCIPLLPGVPWKRALRALAVEGLFTLGLTLWWVLPLLLGRPYSIDFGVNWDVDVLAHMPLFLRVTALPAILMLWLHLRRWKQESPALRAFTALLLVLGVSAGLLFTFGYAWTPVFVNVRLWPFMLYAALALCAVAGYLLLPRLSPLMVWPLLGLLLAIGWNRPNHAREWATYNFSGLELLPAGHVIPALLEPLRGTAGRLANDLHPDNERLGSSRIFEVTPHLIGKPILEGGILNSALGALPAYTIQGELSDNVAGFPTRVQPRAFKPQAGMRHLEYMNVSHFIARSPRTQAAFQAAPNWRLQRDVEGWQLFACSSHNGDLVRVLPSPPKLLKTTAWKDALLEWMYVPAAVADPVLLLAPDEPLPRGPALPLDDATYRAWLDALRTAPAPLPGRVRSLETPVSNIRATAQTIRFRTAAIGAPHLVAISWYPNWQVQGADHVYRVTPIYMLVYPTHPEVVLRFAPLPRERAATALTALTWVALCGWVCVRFASVRIRRHHRRQKGAC